MIKLRDNTWIGWTRFVIGFPFAAIGILFLLFFYVISGEEV